VTREQAAELLATHSGFGAGVILADAEVFQVAYQRAVKRLHPDTASGDTEAFKRLQQAKKLLRG